MNLVKYIDEAYKKDCKGKKKGRTYKKKVYFWPNRKAKQEIKRTLNCLKIMIKIIFFLK